MDIPLRPVKKLPDVFQDRQGRVSYIEGKYEWHSHSINEEEFRIALRELDAVERELDEQE